MTLEEAIKHAEEVAEEQEGLYGLCPASESEISHCNGTNDCKTLKNGKNKGCLKCAEEHRQLAEWLRELKAYREQEPCDDVVSRQDALNAVTFSEVRWQAIERIKQLPSVRLQEPKTEKRDKECI